jgi:two-component system chemotaxis response regulator CheY
MILDLPAQLDAGKTSALVAEMRKLPHAAEIRLNAAAVTDVPLSYLQLLLSTFKSFANASVSDASAEFADAFAGYGLTYPVSAAAQPATEQALAPSEVQPAVETASASSEVQPAIEMALASSEVRPAIETALAPSEVQPAIETALASSVAQPAPETALDGEALNEQTNGDVMPKTILTIDDSRTMRDMLKMALGGAGFTVVQAVDGEDGLNALAQQPVDLIITDINMPKLDGFGVIRAVRNDPQYNSTPILVLSTEGEQESKDIAKDAGATGWIVKPFDPDGLVSIVNKVCG